MLLTPLLLLPLMSSALQSSRLGIQALFLDCDGTICDTETAVTLRQFNQAFRVLHERNPNSALIQWSEEEYSGLLKTGDSKQRYLAYFERTNSWPDSVVSGFQTKSDFAAEMQRLKNEQFDTVFTRTLASGELKLRPGIKKLVEDALARNVPVAVCSNSNYRPVRAIIESFFDLANADIPVYGGDSVLQKKPNPEIYTTAADKFNIRDYSKCLVIEDSNMGLVAAKKAGMRCVVTTSKFTMDEDFSKADLVVSDLESAGLTFASLDSMMISNRFEPRLVGI